MELQNKDAQEFIDELVDQMLAAQSKECEDDGCDGDCCVCHISIPHPFGVRHITKSDRYTIVHWEDGTKTTVSRSDTDEDSPYHAFCAALAKKIYGSTFAVADIVDKKSDEYIKQQKDKEKEERARIQRELEKQNHDRAVRRLAKQMRLQIEATELLERENWLNKLGKDARVNE